ncbi:DUF1707 SHOCT-like domain-containing protein [Marinitenerispora sediminis]|uniref:Uncharacterized protein n=1 Tax=Marinitenerispora sediminis TaxID=1931232 RepID=A0A368TEB0_9ACTN|nr:DUF1707 domain-containing protein [Marinitenerispora sediminis]RCV53653.1 hypothetical protein DEF28_09985 [Marinitenerispora sediminis]RCV57363.1 hypothetical protein DEF23_10895 [Marinitenerispora sediminis]RCV62357.1 hypothetical protein DEF24_01595 [Marinitenerispora sediminis]
MEPDHVRASDADRDRVADRLRDALAEGRLTQDEHEDRLDAVYRAKTLGELVPITRDLPAPDSAGAGGPDQAVGMTVATAEARRLAESSQGRENIVAVFGGAERGGRWLVEPRTNVSVLFGGIELDFREAVLTQREVIVQCAVVFGGLEITVPHGVRVVNGTTAIFGGTSTRGTEAVTDPNAPTIRLTGTCLFGGIEVRAKGPKKGRKRKGR